MKTITVDTWERVQLVVIVGSSTAPNIMQLRLGNKALDVLELTEEEKTLIGWRDIGLGQAMWEPRHNDHQWELEFTDDVWPVVELYVKNFQAWPQGRRAETLYDKVIERDK